MGFTLFPHEALLATMAPSCCTGIRAALMLDHPCPCARHNPLQPRAPDPAPRAAVRLKPMTPQWAAGGHCGVTNCSEGPAQLWEPLLGREGPGLGWQA